MSGRVRSRIQTSLSDFWDRQRARAAARQSYREAYLAEPLPRHRQERRPADPRADWQTVAVHTVWIPARRRS